jgi:hypothetical protein
VLLSSHLLHGVQATRDHLVVISAGAVVAAGPLDGLLASPACSWPRPTRRPLTGPSAPPGAGYEPGPDRAFTVDLLDGLVTSATPRTRPRIKASPRVQPVRRSVDDERGRLADEPWR